MNTPSSPLPLAHLTVLELAAVLAGPSVGCFLAELGARVIKIEPPGRGDLTRAWYLPGEAEGISAYYSCINWGKESVCLNLKHPQAREAIHRLLPQVDVVIANYKPGSAAKLGMDYDTLRALRPDLVYGSITGYGEANPRAGFDVIVQAESGVMYLNRGPGQPPMKMPVALMDLLAAHQLKEGLLTALLHRERTGQGAFVHTSLIEAAVSNLANVLAAWLWSGTDPEPIGNNHPSIVPYGSIYACGDGHHVVLAVGTDAQFAHLCQLLNVPHLAADPRYATNRTRVEHRDELNPLLEQAMQPWQRDALMHELELAKIPAGRILRIAQGAALPDVQHLLLSHPLAQGMGMRTAAFGSSAWGQAPLSPPPSLGQHTHSVLGSLGYTEAEIATMSSADKD